MNLALFGGTFDPPHRAHAMAVLWALQSGEVHRVLVVPNAKHPFGKQPVAAFHHRLEMCRLMLHEFAGSVAEVSDIEQRRPGISYTIDTVRQLISEHPRDNFRLMVGTDIVDDLPNWREGEELVRLAPPLVIPRIVDNSDDPTRGVRPGALPLLSSSLVREVLHTGKNASLYVPARVLAYIHENNLYNPP